MLWNISFPVFETKVQQNAKKESR